MVWQTFWIAVGAIGACVGAAATIWLVIAGKQKIDQVALKMAEAHHHIKKLSLTHWSTVGEGKAFECKWQVEFDTTPARLRLVMAAVIICVDQKTIPMPGNPKMVFWAIREINDPDGKRVAVPYGEYKSEYAVKEAAEKELARVLQEYHKTYFDRYHPPQPVWSIPSTATFNTTRGLPKGTEWRRRNDPV